MLETLNLNPAGRLRAAIYGRSATASGTINSQVRACRETAKNFGWDVSLDHIKVDRAVSGRRLARCKGWEELKRLARATPQAFDVIVTFDVSRLGRSLPIVLREIEELEKFGVFVYVATPDLDSRELKLRAFYMLQGPGADAGRLFHRPGFMP